MRRELDRGVAPRFYTHQSGLEPSEAAMMMTVTELARRVGVTPDTVRHYLRLGLLQPRWHPDNRYRLFTDADAGRLYFIHGARMFGFSLKEIAEILAASAREDAPCPQERQIVACRAARNQTRLIQLERPQDLVDATLKTWERLSRPGSERPRREGADRNDRA